MSEPEDERIDYELDMFMEERGYTCSVAAAKVNELEIKVQRLSREVGELYMAAKWDLCTELSESNAKLKAENKEIIALNHQLNMEYKKTWDVLRTYNPKDIELEYIGFETVEVVEA